MTKFTRIWLVFAVIAAGVLGGDFAYLKWRGRALLPLSAPIDLAHPGTYTFHVDGLAAARYIPEFRLQLPFTTDVYNWFPDDGYRQLWADSPPEIGIEVRDEEGHPVLSERGRLTRPNGWIVSGKVGASVVDVYKLSKINGRPSATYRVSLTILRGSPKAATYQPRFRIVELQEYALLLPTLSFLALAALVMVTAFTIGLFQLLTTRANG
jgi:hypothetical protein